MTRRTRGAESGEDPEGASRARFALLLVLALALALRLWNAQATSLWLDDFHSLFHARAVGSEAFWPGVESDNHPPLSFLLLGGARDLFGESEVALALPALLYGLLGVLVLFRLPDLGGVRVRTAAGLLLALSTLHLEASSNLRMYALLALGVIGTTAALIRVLEEGRGVVGLIAFGAVGLHAHYQFVHAFLLLSGCALALALSLARYRARLGRLALGLLGAVALAAPWYLTGFRAQLAGELEPGGTEITLARLAEGYLHLVFHGVGDHGAAARAVFVLAGAAALVLALAGAVRLLSGARRGERTAMAVLVVASGLCLPAWIAAAAWVAPRSGFDWRYLIGATPAFCALIAVGGIAGGLPLVPLRRLATVAVSGAALALAFLTAGHPGHEDYRGAVRALLAELEPGDALLAADWQPRIFPHGIGWEYYRGRLAGEEEPIVPQLEHEDDFTFVSGTDLYECNRVLCLLRNVPAHMPMLRELRKVFPGEESRAFGRGVYVVTFTR